MSKYTGSALGDGGILPAKQYWQRVLTTLIQPFLVIKHGIKSQRYRTEKGRWQICHQPCAVKPTIPI